MAELSPEQVEKIAELSRLSLTPEQAESARSGLAAVLGYVERLGELDLAGIEPMAGPNDESNRLRADEPGGSFAPDVVRGLAPDSVETTDAVYIHVPKVLGDGGGA